MRYGVKETKNGERGLRRGVPEKSLAKVRKTILFREERHGTRGYGKRVMSLANILNGP